jgi:hypothetical protein
VDEMAASQEDASVHVHHQAAEDRTVARGESRVGKSHFWRHFVQMIGLMHVLMLPAMLIAMLSRREEYSYAHR